MPQRLQNAGNGKGAKKTSNGANKTTVWRFSAVIVFFALWATGIGARLVYLQTTQHEFLMAKAAEQRFRERRVKPLRGSILDRQGRELAITLETESLWVDPSEIDSPETLSYRIANLIGEKPKNLLTTITDAKAANRRFLWLAREVDRETAQKIKDTSVPALRWQREQKRFYPHGKLAAQVVGFANRDDVGQAGVELTQDKNLRGEQNEITEEHDGKGRVYEMSERLGKAPRNVQLTIDYAIQYRAEQALAAGLDASRAKAGTAVVLDPRTGEILAMASAPTFDPNSPAETPPDLLQNRAAQTLYEPGSTFKLVTYSSALETGATTVSDMIDARAGFIKIGQRVISDSHAAGKPLSITEAFAQSSNVAAVTLGQRVGRERLNEFVRRFGYGATTGVELPAETRGRLAPPEKWTADSVASISIGYEIGVTTLQSAAAYAAIANDGVRVAPHLVREIREEDGTIAFQAAPEKRRVVSLETAAAVRTMLETVTADGTGKAARIEGYTSAGKTGTARKFDPKLKRYAPSKYVASFVGFAPADNPAVVIAVMIDEPSAGSYYGGSVAAPIFREIAEQILPELNVAPKFADEVLTAKNENAQPLQPIKVSLPTKLEENENQKEVDEKKSSVADGEKANDKNAPKPSVANGKNIKEKSKQSVVEKNANESRAGGSRDKPAENKLAEKKTKPDKKAAMTKPPNPVATKTKTNSQPKQVATTNLNKTKKT
jgi:cell division protein FtsI (penicillin-binding protein 3)